MKNRKTIIVAFLLVAALCLGIGYAALSDQLSITGSANIDTNEAQEVFDADVYFSGAVLATAPEGYGSAEDYSINTKKIGTDDTDSKPDGVEIKINHGLAVTGDKFTFTLTIANDCGRNVAVALKTALADGELSSTSTNGYFIASIVGDNSFTIESGKTKDITVSVELLKTVDSEITAAEFGIYLTATSAG